MKRLTSILLLMILTKLFYSCLTEEVDKEENVVMTIYPETTYGKSILSNVWTETVLFSDSDENKVKPLINITYEQFDFEYERGYEYTFKARKIWMSNPPQDVSQIKYIFVGPVSKIKKILDDSQEELELTIASETVMLQPSFPTEYEGEIPKIYHALFANTKNNDSPPLVLKEIEGFDFQKGYEYKLRVVKETIATPYSVKYRLIEVIDRVAK
ncbi:MAG: DUF4377 domain-containing protein [Tannerellaceae bacterium]